MVAACSPYETALQDGFSRLAPEVRRAHLAPLIATGTLDVEHGSHWLVPMLIRLLKLPAAGSGLPTRLEVTTRGDELLWSRRIGDVVLRTRQAGAASRIVERHRAGSIAFHLSVEDGSLLYRQVSLSVVGVRIPAPIAPNVTARVSAAGTDRWNVAVVVLWRGHLVCRYGGQMTCA